MHNLKIIIKCPSIIKYNNFYRKIIMLSNGQKNFIIGSVTVVVLILIALLSYKILSKEKDPIVENNLTEKNLGSMDNKLVHGLNKDQFISKWCEFNSQDPIACLGMIQQCKADTKSSDCDIDAFNKMELSWNKDVHPDPYFGKEVKINQKILKSYCQDFSSNATECVINMNACFDNTSTDKSCKDYINNFKSETNNGTEYGAALESTTSSPNIEDIFNKKVSVTSVKACKGNSNCNIFYALAQNWDSIPESETKKLARDGNGYSLWKGYSYTDDMIYDLASAGEEVFYNGGSANAANERIFAQGLAVLLHLQGPQNY